MRPFRPSPFAPVLVLVLASPAPAQDPILVQQAANSGGSLAAVALSLPRLPAPGNLLVICHDSSSSRNSSVIGGGVNGWTLCATSIPDKTNSQIWAGIVGNAPSTEIVVTLGSSPNWASASVTEWSGLGAPMVFEGVSSFGFGGTGSSPVTTGSLPAEAGDLVIATMGVHGAGQTISLPTHGFTDLLRPLPQSGTTMASASLIPTGAGAVHTTWTIGYNRGWATALAVFANPNGGSGPGGPGEPPGGGSPVLVQQSASSGSAIGTLGVTLPQPPTQGNVLVLSHDSTSGGNSRISGGGVSTWILCVSSLPEQDNSEIWAGIVDGTPSTQVSIRLGGSPNSACANVTEWSGLATPLVFDAVATWSGLEKSRPAVTGTVPVAASDLVIATAGSHAGSMQFGAATGGFLDLDRAPNTVSSVMTAAYLLPAAAGTAATSWSMSFRHHWAAAIAAFRAR